MLSLRIFHNSSVTTIECTGKIRTFLLYVELMDVDKLIRRFMATEAILKGLCQLESMRSVVMQITFNCQKSIVFNA